MQKNVTCYANMSSHHFYEDLALILDMYQENDSIECLLKRVKASSAPPVNPDYSLEQVAMEVFKPQILDMKAAVVLKKAGIYLPATQFRGMISCMALITNEVLRCFMSEVLWNLKSRGFDGIYAMQIYEFSAQYLNKNVVTAYFNKDNVDERQTAATEEQIAELTRYIIKSLISHQIIKVSSVVQSSKSLCFSFDQIAASDSTVIFLMYWLRELDPTTESILANNVWHTFGLNKPKLICRLKEPPLNNFFTITNVWETHLKYTHKATIGALNRLKLMYI